MSETHDLTIKSLSEINRQEYILYEWTQVTITTEAIPVMLKGRMRTPAEALVAEKEFDTFLTAYRTLFPPSPIKIDMTRSVQTAYPETRTK